MIEKQIKIEYSEPKIQTRNVPDFRDLAGTIPTITTFPTWVPKKYNECLAIYNATTAYKFCVYVDNSWKSVNLT